MAEITESRKTNYWQKRSLEHIREMRAARLAGLFPKSEGWRNVVEHELVEFEAFDVLAEAVGLSIDERRKGATASLLHDVFKRKEREAFVLKGPEGAKNTDKEQVEFLESLGYEQGIAELTKLVGGYSLPYFLEDSQDEALTLKKDIPLTELIIHYVDDITLGNELVPLKKRIEYVKGRYKEEDEAGKGMFGGRPPSDVQYEVSRQIEMKLAGLVGVEEPESLPNWINTKIEKRINSQ